MEESLLGIDAYVAEVKLIEEGTVSSGEKEMIDNFRKEAQPSIRFEKEAQEHYFGSFVAMQRSALGSFLASQSPEPIK